MGIDRVQSQTSMRGIGLLPRKITALFFRARYIRIYRSYVPVWMLFLAALELVVLGVTLLVTTILLHPYDVAVDSQLFNFGMAQISVYVLTLFVCMIAMGLYQRRLREGSAGIALRILISHIFGSLCLLAIFFAFPRVSIATDILAVTLVFSCSSVLFARIFFLRFVGTDVFKRRILVLGSGKRAAKMIELKRWIDQVGYSIIGFIHVDGDSDEVESSRMVELSEDEKLADYVSKNCIDEIVIAFDDRRRKISMEELLDCKMNGVHIIDLLNFYERETYKLKLDIMDPSWLIFSDGFSHNSWFRWTKRAFDVVVSGTILLVALPIMLLAAIAIVIESGGPLFYLQTRVGEGGKQFLVMKFRSMVVNAEKDGAQWATKGDSRITKVGAFMRLTRIDELPQLLNVLKGNMSFVGPRPERPEFVEQFNDRIPYYDERHRVKPGITGWAQVCYPYGASEEDAYEKLQYDLYYAKNYSMFLDMMILLQTAEVIIWQKGAR